jgi:vancomycin resistance protein YoaR
MTTEPLPASAPHRGRSLGAKFAIAFILGLVLVAAAGSAGLYAYGQQYTGRVLPGVRIGSVDLSGLTPEAAAAALGTAYASLGTGSITLTGPEGDVVIAYKDIGRGPDTRAMADAALAAGRQGQPAADLVGAPQTAIHGVTLDTSVTYDRAKLAAAVAAAAAPIDRQPVDATLRTAKDGTYQTTESVSGRTVDQQAIITAISGQLSALDGPAAIKLPIPVTTVAPSLETQAVVAATQAAGRMATDIVLTRDGTSWTIPAAKVRSLISFSTPGDGTVTPVVDETAIDSFIAPIVKDLNQTAKSATFKLNGSQVVVASKGREGRTVDVAGTHAAIAQELQARQAGTQAGTLEPVVATQAPAITTPQAVDAAPKMREISTWTTWFPIWSHNGFGANIWIPASLINGYVVGPGETFDFWKVVGDVSFARGYRLGGAIIDGHTQAQGAIGGGICSCSTTLFNAALRAGYKMGARLNHFYYINRYPLGLDATVFKSDGGSFQTMTWTNDTKYPVLIRGINTRGHGKGFVTFKLYSLPTNRKIAISAPTVKNPRHAGDSTQQSDTLRAGHSQRIEVPTDGMDVWRTVTVTENGKVLRKTTYYSHYAAVTGVVLIGTGGPSAPTSVP